jgi:nucleoside-triphosphatase
MPSYFLTGAPGVGKTTVLMKIINILGRRDLEIGGMISREVRRDGKRVGFEVLDFMSGEKGWLARVNQDEGVRIGKYRVNAEDLENIGVKSLINAVDDADVIVCDEIGPMELTSKRFRGAVSTVVRSGKPVIGTIHHSLSKDLIDELRDLEDLAIFRVTLQNRDAVPLIVAGELFRGMVKKS